MLKKEVLETSQKNSVYLTKIPYNRINAKTDFPTIIVTKLKVLQLKIVKDY